MYVMEKDGQHYVYVRGNKTYVSTLRIKGTSAITIYLPDGTLLTNASVTVNDTVYTTDANGKVYLTGEYSKPATYTIVNADGYTAEVRVIHGTDATVTLKMYTLTVTATGFTYSQHFTVKTTIGGKKYTGSIVKDVVPGTSVTVNVDGMTVGDWQYYGSNVVVDGTSTGKTSHTFTMEADHVITFTNGYSNYIGSGT